MKKFDFRNIRIKKINLDEIDDRTLLINLYVTQFLTLFIGMIILFFQSRLQVSLFSFHQPWKDALYGIGFAVIVLISDLLISRWVPEDATDDGGINEKIFLRRSFWHIILLTAAVAICEEILFRGAIQHAWGAYWTSVFFAAIHVRYLRHWLMTGLVFSISYGLGWIYIQTGSLWTPILAHFIIDLVMGMVIRYKVDDHE